MQVTQTTNDLLLYPGNVTKEMPVLLSAKINELRTALILETDAATKFKLQHQIDEAETLLKQIEQRLTEMSG